MESPQQSPLPKQPAKALSFGNFRCVLCGKESPDASKLCLPLPAHKSRSEGKR